MSQTDIPDWENELILYLTSAGDRRRTIAFIQSLLERQRAEIIGEIKEDILRMDYNSLASGFLSVRAIIEELESLEKSK